MSDDAIEKTIEGFNDIKGIRIQKPKRCYNCGSSNLARLSTHPGIWNFKCFECGRRF